MKSNIQIVLIIIVTFLLSTLIVGEGVTQESETKKDIRGLIAFDFPNAPEAKVEVNLSGKLISLVARAAKREKEVAELIEMLKGVYVRVYDNSTASFDELVHHYENKLEQGKWEVVAKVREANETVQVRMLLDEDTIFGLFVIVAGETETILVNIVGLIDPARIGELIEKFEELGLPGLDEMEIKTDRGAKEK